MQRLRLAVLAACLSTVAAWAAEGPRERVDLNGSWQFRLDPANEGLAQKWFSAPGQFTGKIAVPGAWQAQGFGQPSAQLRHNFEGTAWYQRSVTIPASWNGRRTVLRLGGAHRRVTLFVNGVELGGHDGFSAPFEFDISSAVKPGGENSIVLRIENPPVAIEASPDKQKPLQPTGMLNYIGNWGGIFGSVELASQPTTRVSSVLITSDVARRRIAFHVHVDTSKPATLKVTVPGEEPVTKQVASTGEEQLVEITAVHLPLWSPDDPQLRTAVIQLLDQGREIDRVEQRFGFREVSTQGNTLLLNGKPLYLRGYGDDNVEVLTGFPPSARAVFVERLKRAKSFGFNAVRFHSMTPPAEYFEAADEVGMLVMAELPAAYTQYFFAHRDFLKRELTSVLMAHRNHPSLLSLGFGNEFNLQWLENEPDRASFLESVSEFYKAAKQLAPATLILSNDGFDMRPTDMVSLYHGAPADRPTVRHEFGQYYCSLPDPTLIDDFTGVVQPTWLQSKKEWVAANHLESIYPTYVRNSQRLQQLGRKFQIERVRRDGAVSGYHYWLIVDYPGGTGEGDSWEEGWFDYFWRPKGITPEDGRALNTPVLLMLDAGVDNRSLWAGEPKQIGVQVSNYGADAVHNGRLTWALRDGDRQLSGAVMTGVEAGLGKVSTIGAIQLDTGALREPRKLDLVLTLDTGHGEYRNRWQFWAYPRPRKLAAPALPVVSNIRSAALHRQYPWLQSDLARLTPHGLLVTEELDAAAMAHLQAGGRVWLLLKQTLSRRGVEFFPASGGAAGTLVSDHPALAGFPHEGFCDLQFYNLVDAAFPLPIDGWTSQVQPIVGGIRTTSQFLSKAKNLSRVAFAAEAKVGAGRLLVTTLKLKEHFDEAYPEAMSLFDSLLRYTTSEGFDPKETVPEAALRRLVEE
ncbi:sugar-binding domain-containing protein [uncultured Paludibaculum sp.]|uniref:glycoside hydrolase family 2 protein n=1 Tax=uncultured Paludibaculum sp. TaxID=1765020 RepID=UPI002AABAB07|nr:sugar-binding domain-containing protein [uncultured Paludibaculum sp.]